MTEPDYLRNRGLESRGTESRGTEDRLGSGPHRGRRPGLDGARPPSDGTLALTDDAPGTGTGPAAGASAGSRAPGASAPGPRSRNPILRRVQEGLDQARAEVARELQARQQEAEQLRDGLLPFFDSTFVQPSRGAKPYNGKIGASVFVRVLRPEPYKAKRRITFERWYREELAALVKYRPKWVADQLDIVGKYGILHGDYSNGILPSTVLHPLDAASFFPSSWLSNSRTAGFYSPFDDVVYLAHDGVSIAVLAHELCHAYAATQWDEVYLTMVAHAVELAGKISILDEAVTSELADLVLLAWHAGQKKGGAPRSGSPPDGYIGYGPSYRRQGMHFVSRADGAKANRPGPVTMECYFGGRIEISVAKDSPPRSIVKLGSAKTKHRLSELLA